MITKTIYINFTIGQFIQFKKILMT